MTGSGAGLRRVAGGLARACHPGPCVAVTVLVTALAIASGRDTRGCVLVAAAVLSGQLSVGWCNDAADARLDRTALRRSKPIVANLVSVGTVRAAAVISLLLCVPLSLASGVLAGTVHLTGVGAAWAYDLGLKATVVSWVPYAVGFGGLPAFVTLGLPGQPWPAWWAIPAAALLGCGAHLANALPDIPSDLAAGVRGWPQRLGVSRAGVLAPLLLLSASLLLVLGPARGIGVTEWVALAAAGTLAASGLLLHDRLPRAPFAAAIGVAAVDVALLVGHGSWLTG
ncbi:UbiA family prenyltransferase [Nonomuraea lactucae]|uniref:UbiA family prenyltransferase n=1 Tax=Nonomuraea lactucae TaxID=2249762 RepID=UPI001F0711F0|nr:UbiA family prenyltransferase [Nonomuraea lactucae]